LTVCFAGCLSEVCSARITTIGRASVREKRGGHWHGFHDGVAHAVLTARLPCGGVALGVGRDATSGAPVTDTRTTVVETGSVSATAPHTLPIACTDSLNARRSIAQRHFATLCTHTLPHATHSPPLTQPPTCFSSMWDAPTAPTFVFLPWRSACGRIQERLLHPRARCRRPPACWPAPTASPPTPPTTTTHPLTHPPRRATTPPD
jgi:hypothetical protein